VKRTCPPSFAKKDGCLGPTAVRTGSRGGRRPLSSTHKISPRTSRAPGPVRPAAGAPVRLAFNRRVHEPLGAALLVRPVEGRRPRPHDADPRGRRVPRPAPIPVAKVSDKLASPVQQRPRRHRPAVNCGQSADLHAGLEGVYAMPGASSGRLHDGSTLVAVSEKPLILRCSRKSSGQVISGSGRPPETRMTQGQSLYNPAKAVHNAKNGSKTAPAKVLVVLIGEKGAPLTTPVQ
jgi:hypothetical protein